MECAHEHVFIDESFSESFLDADHPDVESIEIVHEEAWLYDPTNVRDGAIYLHDGGFISHNTFLGSANTLISGADLLRLKPSPAARREQDGSFVVYEDPRDGHSYVLAADTSRGRGMDYSAFSVIDVTEKPFRQVAVFRDNMISPLIYPNVIHRIAQRYNDDVGGTVADVLYHELEYDNMYVMSALKARHNTEKGKQTPIGLNMNKRVKHIGCSHLKDLVEQTKLVVPDDETIFELSTFVARGKSWEADVGCHDDLVMGLVCFAWFASSMAFGDSTNVDLRKMLYERRMREIDDDLLPGFLRDDGHDEVEEGGWRRVRGGAIEMDVPSEDEYDRFSSRHYEYDDDQWGIV